MQVISRKEAKEKGLKRYFTGKPCKYGHVSERRVDSGSCIECAVDHHKKWYDDNKEHKKEYGKEYYKKWYDDNKEHKKEYRKSYQRTHKDHIRKYQKEYMKNWSAENKEKVNEYRRNRYKTNEDYKLSEICRHMLKRTIKSTTSTKSTRTHEMLGYCSEQLKESIEDKFLDGMNWENYPNWHIDHIYPLARYIKDGVEDPSIINHLDNLIPMWADHNLEKSGRTLEEYLDDRPDLYNLYGHFLTQHS